MLISYLYALCTSKTILKYIVTFDSILKIFFLGFVAKEILTVSLPQCKWTRLLWKLFLKIIDMLIQPE